MNKSCAHVPPSSNFYILSAVVSKMYIIYMADEKQKVCFPSKKEKKSRCIYIALRERGRKTKKGWCCAVIFSAFVTGT